MFDLSIWEIFLIICACIIFLKPEDLPKIIKMISETVRKIKSFSDEIMEMVNEKNIAPKITKIIGEDGKEYDAYDLKEVFPEKKDAEDGTK